MDPGGAEVAPASDAAARGLHRAGQHAHRAAPPPPSRLHVHADAEVRVLHYDELRVEAAQAPKVGRPAELRLVACSIRAQTGAFIRIIGGICSAGAGQTSRF